MSGGDRESLRVALLYHSYGSPPVPGTPRVVRELAIALRDAGHRPFVLSSRPGRTRRSLEEDIRVVRSGRLPEAPLRWRGFVGPVTHLPLAALALVREPYDVAQAFSPADTLAALLARRTTGKPALFTCAETLDREGLADRRLRLWLLTRAVEDTDAVTSPTEKARVALQRWLAVEPALIEPGDAPAHERLYRRLLNRRS